MERVIVTRPVVGLAAMQVCAVKDATDEEILTVCNRENPAGTSGGWAVVCRENGPWGEIAPVVCDDNPDRLHFIVMC